MSQHETAFAACAEFGYSVSMALLTDDLRVSRRCAGQTRTGKQCGRRVRGTARLCGVCRPADGPSTLPAVEPAVMMAALGLLSVDGRVSPNVWAAAAVADDMSAERIDSYGFFVTTRHADGCWAVGETLELAAANLEEAAAAWCEAKLLSGFADVPAVAGLSVI